MKNKPGNNQKSDKNSLPAWSIKYSAKSSKLTPRDRLLLARKQIDSQVRELAPALNAGFRSVERLLKYCPESEKLLPIIDAGMVGMINAFISRQEINQTKQIFLMMQQFLRLTSRQSSLPVGQAEKLPADIIAELRSHFLLIAEVLARRRRLVDEVGKIKLKLKISAHQPQREAEIRELFVNTSVKHGLDSALAQDIFTIIHAASVKQQESDGVI